MKDIPIIPHGIVGIESLGEAEQRSFYAAMLALVEDNGPLAASQLMIAVQIVAAIAVGAAVTSVIFRMLAQRKRRRAA